MDLISHRLTSFHHNHNFLSAVLNVHVVFYLLHTFSYNKNSNLLTLKIMKHSQLVKYTASCEYLQNPDGNKG